jgi:hypothetical protein
MSDNTYEKTRLKDRAKELIILFAFIIGALISSIIIMDLIIFPISLFSINNKEIFNHFVKYTTWIIFIALSIYLIGRKIYLLRKDGMGYNEIMKIILFKPLRFLMSMMIFVVLSSMLLLLIYSLMSYNYYILYKIINI